MLLQFTQTHNLLKFFKIPFIKRRYNDIYFEENVIERKRKSARYRAKREKYYEGNDRHFTDSFLLYDGKPR